VHSGVGHDTASIFYWNADAPVWDHLSGMAILRDATRDIIDMHEYASC
jgi:hypothetical protein